MSAPGVLPFAPGVAIAGASGQMGGLFRARAEALGLPVLPLHRDLSEESLAALPGCPLVILSVPVPAMEAVLARVVPHLAPGAVLADLCSVKAVPLAQMLEAYPGPVVGAHPLFGPVIPEGFEPRVAVVEGRDPSAAAAFSALMEAMGFIPFSCTAEEHDRAVAMVQGLNYTTTVAYLAAMRHDPGFARFVTPSFNRRLDSAHKMLTADKDLFRILAETNPFSQEAVRLFSSYLSLAAGGDTDLLASRALDWWPPRGHE